jgi:hypothetical protein
MRVGAAIEQELRNAVLVVVESNHQGRDAFRHRKIDIRFSVEKRLDTRVAAAFSCIQERRKAAVRVILCARLRRNLAWPVVMSGASVHVGALRDQDLYHLRCIAGGGGSPH